MHNQQSKSPNDTILFHIPYHQKDPIFWSIQQTFRSKFLQNEISTAGFRKMTIAYSRPRNLGEMLSYRKIDSFNCPPIKKEKSKD